MNKFLITLIIFLLLQLGYSANGQVTDTIRVHTGWNMVSLPLKVQDAYYLTLYPGVITKALIYGEPWEKHKDSRMLDQYKICQIYLDYIMRKSAYYTNSHDA